jgi:hypothetical protein
MEEEIQGSSSARKTESPRSARAPRASVKAQSRLGHGPFRSRSPTRRSDTVAARRGLRGAPQIRAGGTSAQGYRDPFRSPSPRRGRPPERSQPEQNWLGQEVTPPLAMEAPTAPRLVAQVVVAATRPLRLIQRARVGPRPRTRTCRTLASKAASQTLQLCQGHPNTRAARWQSDGTSCAPISRTTSL